MGQSVQTVTRTSVHAPTSSTSSRSAVTGSDDKRRAERRCEVATAACECKGRRSFSKVTSGTEECDCVCAAHNKWGWGPGGGGSSTVSGDVDCDSSR